jgi:hypothetical protein
VYSLQEALMNKLHIGYHKTGTTFLQTKIFPSHPLYIPQYGRHFPNIQSQSSSNVLAKTYKEGFNSLRAEGLSNFLYSNENMCKLDFHELGSILSEFGKFHILITIRNQSQHIASTRNWIFGNDRRRERNKIFKNPPNGVPDVTSEYVPADVLEFYDYNNVVEILRSYGNQVTYLWYEDIFSRQETATKLLSEFLDFDVYPLLTSHDGALVNTQTEYDVINVDRFFDNSRLDYQDLLQNNSE